MCATHRRTGRSPRKAARASDIQAKPLTADYTLDDLAAHAALALNRLQAWYEDHAADGDPRWLLAYIRQLYGCLARLTELWKERASLSESELEAALNGALAELRRELAAEDATARGE